MIYGITHARLMSASDLSVPTTLLYEAEHDRRRSQAQLPGPTGVCLCQLVGSIALIRACPAHNTCARDWTVMNFPNVKRTGTTEPHSSLSWQNCFFSSQVMQRPRMSATVTYDAEMRMMRNLALQSR